MVLHNVNFKAKQLPQEKKIFSIISVELGIAHFSCK